MAKGMNKQLIMFLVIFLLFVDFMIAPAMSFIILQYPDFFMMNPAYVFVYILVLEVILNGIIIFLVWFIARKR